MATCKHKNHAPAEVIEAIPFSQANGAGERHRCAICAYEAGEKAGFERAQAEIERLTALVKVCEAQHYPPNWEPGFVGSMG